MKELFVFSTPQELMLIIRSMFKRVHQITYRLCLHLAREFELRIHAWLGALSPVFNRSYFVLKPSLTWRTRQNMPVSQRGSRFLWERIL